MSRCQSFSATPFGPPISIWRCRVFLILNLIAFLAIAAALTSETFGNETSAQFIRAFNLNGPALVVDGNQWDAGSESDLQSDGNAFENQDVPLLPETDAARAQMIRSSRWGGAFDVAIEKLPVGSFQVCVYVWEDNSPENFSLQLNDITVVDQFSTFGAGHWKRLGPWKTESVDGKVKLTAKGGDANLSGIEIWSGSGTVPDTTKPQFETNPSPDHLSFFENKIRPLLIEKCYECHSSESREPGGSLLLDSRSGIVHGGTEPLLVPGNPDGSLLMKAVSYSDPDLKMPPDAKLSNEQITDLATWIRMRAPDPRTEDTLSALKAKTEIDWDKARDFWSLKPIHFPDLKEINQGLSAPTWPTSPIDTFVLRQLDQIGLTPSSPADKRVWIRRATFDLIGLPPTPAEVDQFLLDESSEAFAKVIDRLLQSSQYGERWGRYWLDVVRYSDTAGDNSDFPVPQMYLYRNWVIDAFNRDLPYDQFVKQQLAGDLLESSSAEERRQQVIATGYIANARRFGSRVDDYPQHLTIEDTLDNLGRTFLGTTINCARCHNHKFDPVTAEDYYALYGIFHSTRYPWPGIELEQKQRDFVSLADPNEVAKVESSRKVQQQTLDEQAKQLKKDRDTAKTVNEQIGTDANSDDKDKAQAEFKLAEEQFKKAEEAAQAFSKQPLPFETLYAVAESKRIENVPLQLKGDPLKPAQLVSRRFLTVLNPMVPSSSKLAAEEKTSGRRELANWIVDRTNPLAARVIANRVWLYHFGRGIVPTANDFGRQGKPPSHPELLDWLAQNLMDSGWSLKSLHRTIMLSQTYRMNSHLSAQALELDPTNEMLSAFPKRRLDAEAMRDTFLMLAGNLDTTQAGPHPFPDSSTWKFTQHNPFKANYDTQRRSVYLMTQRIQRHPYLAIFDGADPSVSTPMRLTSTTPLQALYLMNDEFIHKQATGFASRIIAADDQDAKRIDHAWLLMMGRHPDPDEADRVQKYLHSIQSELKATGTNDQDLELASWQSLSRAMMRMNETVYID
jgi:hypothetical protein